MRQPINQNQNGISNLPKITIITCGYKDIQQTYPHIDHIIIDDIATPTAFNEGMKSSSNIVYCFLDKYSDFISQYIVEDVCKIFFQYPELGGLYTDNILNGHRQYYPSYSYQALKEIIIDTPFFCRREVQVQFDETLLEGHYYDGLKKIGQHSILHHIPEALFTINTLR